MPKGSPELTASRREEIINACERLYRTMSFKDITIKEIGEATSFTRTSIYNYFRTKEEIFLALMQREYDLWAEELCRIRDSHDALSPEELAAAIARSLEKREQLLKLLSMNHFDMEEHSRPERLRDFKVAFCASFQAVRSCVEKFFPGTDSERFALVFFPFLFGVYPYTHATEKQLNAMKDAGMEFRMQSVYEIVSGCVLQLLEAG